MSVLCVFSFGMRLPQSVFWGLALTSQSIVTSRTSPVSLTLSLRAIRRLRRLRLLLRRLRSELQYAEAAQYATPNSRKRRKVSSEYIEDSHLPNGTIVEVGTPCNITKLRIIGMEMSLEKKGARYVVEHEDGGKRSSMLILPQDIQSVKKP